MSIQEKLVTIAENQQTVYNAGVAVGKKSEYDAFWDEYQQNGKRAHYSGAFAGKGWNDDTFKPKYPIRPVVAGHMFFYSDISDITTDSGVVIDFSQCTSYSNTFASTTIGRIGVIEVGSGASDMQSTFYGAFTKSIEKLIIHENLKFSNTFAYFYTLNDIVIEGTIGNSISFSHCSALSLESAKSIITHLKDFTGTGNEFTRSVKFHANTLAALAAEGATSPSGNAWIDYINQLGWST